MISSRSLALGAILICLISAGHVSFYRLVSRAAHVPINSPPVANDDSYSLHIPGYIGYFKANDWEPDGEPLTFSITTQPSHGTLSFDYNSVNDHPWYTPAAGFSGADSLVYQICDPSNACDSATVTINVTNQAPNAVDDNASLHQPGYLGYLTSNDWDPEGDPITFLVITQPTHGTLSYDYGPGYSRPWYTPDAGYSGTDSLVYRICDNFNACDTATVNITVANQTPVAVNDNSSLHNPGYLGYLMSNDYDPDGDPMTFLVITQPAHGTLSYDYGPGYSRPWYTPAAGYAGPDSLVYRICDNFNACATATVNIEVTNQIPLARHDKYEVTSPGYIGPFTNNDWEPDGDPLSFSIIQGPSHGTLSFDYGTPGPRPWYTPDAGYSGPDLLVYQICDGFGGCAQASVSINDDDKNSGGTSCNLAAGEPINVSNGNMYLQQTDYLLLGLGLMEITRTYNSKSLHVGLFGKGWSTAYDKSIRPYSGQHLRLYLADGRAIEFNLQSGIYLPVQGDFRGQIVQNGDGSFTLTLKNGGIHQFSKNGKLLWLKDANNNQTTLSYDTSGTLTSVTDPSGRILSFSMNSSGRVTSITDGMGTIASYTYGSGSQLLSVTYADNSGYQFTYGSLNLLTSVTDALGNILEAHTYNSNGRALTSQKHGGVELYTLSYVNATETHVTDALNHVTKYFFDTSKGRNVTVRTEGNCSCGGAQIQTWTYDSQLNLTAKSDALSQTVSYTYDANGNRLTETNSLGTTTFTYNAFGQVLTRTDSMNGAWTNTYDARGNLLTATDPLNHTTTLTYDTQGKLLTITDPRNNTTSFTYDGNGNLTRRTDALNNQTNIAYDSRGRVTSVTNALNQVTDYEYDLAGRLKKIIYPDTNFVLFTYDLAGRRTKIKDPRGYETNFAYDAAYQLTSETNADNKVTSYAYDLMSNLTAVTDALNRTTNYSYDEFNRLTKIKYPEGTPGAGRLEENFSYDLAGNLITKTDQAGKVTTFCYDSTNRLTSAIDPAQKTTSYEYNARSQMTAVVDAINQRYEFVYDQLGRVTQEKKGSATKSFVYDGAGNPSQRTDYNGAVTNYTHDALNRLTTISYPDSTSATYGYDVLSRLTTASNPAGTVTIAYDSRGRVSSVTDVFGQVVSYSYDANSNRTQLSLNSVTSATYQYDIINRLTQLTDSGSLSTTFSYDATNKLTSRTLPNGVVTTSQYDGLNRLTRLTHAKGSNTLADFQYQFNAVNNITQIIDSGGVHNYSYDSLDRLTAATHPAGQTNESYTYDDVGNRTASHQGSSYAYQVFNRLVAANGTSFGYDANGNTISKTDASGSWSYTWDYENRLKQAALSGGVTVNYSYDALGRRVQRTSNVSSTEKFIYDGFDVVRDLDSGGSTVADYLNGLATDEKLRQTSSGGVSYFLTDHLGTTRSLADISGNISANVVYDSFGNVTSGSVPTRYIYTGRESDSDTGAMYYRARWYESKQGRFISEDPIGFRGRDVNLYGYTHNDPLRFVDPSGLRRCNPVLGAILGGIVGGVSGAGAGAVLGAIAGGTVGAAGGTFVIPGFGTVAGGGGGAAAGAGIGALAGSGIGIGLGIGIGYDYCREDDSKKCDKPDNVIPFPTPRPTPNVPPPPPPPPSGRKFGDEICKLKYKQGMFCIYECRDGKTFTTFTDTEDKFGSCPPVAPRPAGL